MAKKDITASATFQGRAFDVRLLEDRKVAFHEGGNFLGEGRWCAIKRRISEAPASIPEGAVRVLSQQLRMSVVSARLDKHRVRRESPSKNEITNLLRSPYAPLFPKQCTRWARVQTGSLYAAFVVAEKEVLFFRNWFLLGSAKWVDGTCNILDYSGSKIPPTVWIGLTRQLEEAPVAQVSS